MSKILSEILAANRQYVDTFGTKGTLALPPARQFAILTCMDATFEAEFVGLSEGAPTDPSGGQTMTRSAHMHFHVLGTKEWLHRCGLAG